MNAELVNQALLKVPNPDVLVNLISQRIRQLTAVGGAASRALVRDVGNLGPADIALREIIEDKIGFEMPEIVKLTRPTARNGKRPQGWLKLPAAMNKMAA